MKAYKIETDVNERGSFTIQIAENAGKAKTQVINGLQSAGYNKATYSWITRCRRAPEFDHLASKGPGCVAWRYVDYESGQAENWHIEDGHWWG